MRPVNSWQGAGFWDTFRHRLVVTGELVCDTGLRVGAGTEPLVPTATDLPVVTVAGRPYVPGSSLRGVLRSHVERIVRTLEPKPGGGQGACDPLDEKACCVTREKIKSWRAEVRGHAHGDDLLAERVWERSCRVCRVFGSPWLASRVRISDLFCIGDVHPEVRDGVAIDREKEAVRNKFDFEVLPAGTRFRLEIVAENLSKEELGLLWLGIRELAEGNVAVGGFKGRGLGRVHLEGLSVRYVDARDREGFRRYLLQGEMKEASLGEAEKWLEVLLEHCGGGSGA